MALLRRATVPLPPPIDDDTMRYTEPKARSAEILRVALGRMGQHDAALNPLSFTLWYEYAAGINPKLKAAVDGLLVDQPRLDDDAVARLYADHIASPTEAGMQQISTDLQRVMNGVAQSATEAGRQAGTFGAQLTDLSEALQSNDIAKLTPHLSEALAGTVEMQSSAEALRQQVAASQNEIARLRNDLNRARGEALVDPLTGVLNRKGFELRLEALLAEPVAEGESHCLVMLDIDHFKKVNDTHGHVIGDRVIQGLGEILRVSVPNPLHGAARYGGEEFAIVLPKCSLIDSAKIAETVRIRTKAMKVRNRATQDVLFTVTLSGGVAAMQPGDDAAALIARADAALYASKHGGRDRVTLG